jgi:intracellular multiplication protein IcmB
MRTLLRALDTLAWEIGDLLGQRGAAYCHQETIDGEDAIVLRDGTRATALELHGIKTALDGPGFSELVARLTQSLGPRMESAGHAMQVVFHYDPGASLGRTRAIYASGAATARCFGMEADWLFEEWSRSIARFTADERLFIVLFTRPYVLSKAEREEARARMATKARRVPAGRSGMRIGLIMAELRDYHRDYCASVQRAFAEYGFVVSRLSAPMLARELRLLIAPSQTAPDWMPWIPGDPLPIRSPDYASPPADPSLLLYPRLSEQVWPVDLEQVDAYTVAIDGVRHAPVMMQLGPKQVLPFNVLLRRLQAERIPARVSFLVEGAGDRSLGMREFLASIANWASDDNKQFNEALEAVRRRTLEGINHVRLQITADTWIEESDSSARIAERLRRQQGTLLTLLQQWGQISATKLIGEPVFGVAATLPACLVSAPGPRNTPPLADAIALWPLTRPASLWDGGLLLNTPDGKLFPFTIGSSQQASWGHFTFAGLGAGKSVWENTLDLMFLLAPGLTRLPHLAIIDIGPSSRGLVDFVRALLPVEERHRAVYRRLRQRPEDGINPFDTPLGCDRPSSHHLEYLVNLLALLATPDDREAPEDGVEGVIRQAIKFAFDEYSRERRPKKFEPAVDEVVTRALAEIDYEIDQESSWWEAVDVLFDAGRAHEAALAQRYAVPLLQDIGALALNPSVSDMYRIKRPNGETLAEYLHRICVEAISRYPILANPTQLDLGEAHVIALDLDEVAPRGGATADKTTGVMYMLARQAAAARFFMMPEHVRDMPLQYREYHAARIDRMRQDPKKLRYDEIHRIVRKSSVTQQVVADLDTAQRESRKWNLHIGMASQRMGDIPEALLSLVTTVYVLGVGDVEEAKMVGQRLGLNSLLTEQLTQLGKPGPRGAKMVVQFRTAEGVVTHVLMNTLPPSLVWAFSTTTEDVAIRTALYERLDVRRALTALSAQFPGSAKPEVERRRQLRTESGRGAATDVIDEIVKDVLNAALASSPDPGE